MPQNTKTGRDNLSFPWMFTATSCREIVESSREECDPFTIEAQVGYLLPVSSYTGEHVSITAELGFVGANNAD